MRALIRIFALSLVVAVIGTTEAAPPANSGDFEYTAEGRVERASGGRALTWTTTGQVTALDRTAAEAKANAAVDQFLKDMYPGFVEVQGSRKVTVRAAPAPVGGPNRTTLRATVVCPAYVQQERGVLTIFAWDVITEKVTIDRFTVRVVVSHDGKDETYENEISTLGRGKPGDSIRTFQLWTGDFVSGESPKEFSIRVFHKNLPDSDRFAQPAKPNPADPNDGYTEVGSFRVKLSHRDGHLAADWVPGALVKPVGRPRLGPGLLSQRFIVKQTDVVPFDLSVHALKEADAQAAREALLNAEWEKQEEMRRKLGGAGPDIKVFTGAAQGKAPAAKGPPSSVGIGRLVVLSANREAAEAYVAKEFPRDKERGTVVIVASEDEAKAALRAAFSAAFPNGQLDGEPRLTPKTGRTIMDKIGELPPRPPKKNP